MSEYNLVEDIPKISEYEVFISYAETMPEPNATTGWTEIQGLETAAIEVDGEDVTVYYLGRNGSRTIYNMEISPTLVITGVRTKNDPGQTLLFSVDNVFATGADRKCWIKANFGDDTVYGKATPKPYGFGGGAANEIPRIDISFAFDGKPTHVKKT